MTAISFVLQAIITIIVLTFAIYMLIRAIRNNRRWKKFEPLLVESIEKHVGQKIVFKTLQNALPSPEADAREASLLWMAFTAGYVIFIARDALLEGGGDNVFIARKRDASILRVGRYKAELEVKNEDATEVAKLILMAGRSRYELLTQYIPEKRGKGSRF